jgi:hypothetical protein
VNGHALPEGHPRTNHTLCLLPPDVERIYGTQFANRINPGVISVFMYLPFSGELLPTRPMTARRAPPTIHIADAVRTAYSFYSLA